jgi:hypothetical protein
MSEEGGRTEWWLASSWSVEDICDPEGEWEYLELTPEKLREEWFAFRWTTDEERANEDWLYDQFGDWEYNGFDTSMLHWRVKPDTPGAFKYWTSN